MAGVIQKVFKRFSVNFSLENLSSVYQVSFLSVISADSKSDVIQRVINPTPAAEDAILDAYEFAVDHIGHDPDSGEIWADFILFIKSRSVNAVSKGQKNIEVLRKAYHRAVQIPLENVDVLWKELDLLEYSLDKFKASRIYYLHWFINTILLL
jgi:hypothetical protein